MSSTLVVGSSRIKWLQRESKNVKLSCRSNVEKEKIIMMRMLDKINFSTIFVDPEVPSGAQSMKRFHKDLERAIAEIRKNIPNADEDPGFKQAAEAMTQAIVFGKQLESVSLSEALANEKERIKWMYMVG